MIRVVIVDDELPARELLREFLSADEDCEIVAECANGFEAVKAVAQHDPDLLLLDIQMPKLDGFEVLELLDRSPIVVFVTAHDEHALRAFEVHALDYLLKPLSQERFQQVMERVRRAAGHERQPVAGLASSLRAKPLQRIVVRGDDGAIQVVPVSRLDFIEAADDAILLATAGTKLRKQQPISDLAAQLDPDRFVRIHRAYVVNIERIEKIELYAKDSRVAILRDGTKLPVSRSGYQRLKELL
ncbi:MAG: two-component system, LytTR family, response regulator [Thermoanaerobaculia bacterium]|jgi:two-component system LytT family response regulator|nr:two-component system, LytTR family, response regulator [Thermoanaerobaculia bacterium]